MNKWIDELLKAYVRVAVTVMLALTAIIFLCSFQTAEYPETESMESEIVESSTLELIGDVSTVISQQTQNETHISDTYSHSSQSTPLYYSTKELTAYTATGNACADGVYPSAGYTAASNDPNLWHKWVHIEGYGDFYIHDTGGMSTNVIDIYMNTRSECIQFGRKKGVSVYVYD